MNTLLATNKLDITVAGLAICRALDLTIDPGQCWGILGKNGSGKTTLLHTLAGLRPPDSGIITLLNKRLDQWSRRDIAKHVGILFQDNDDRFPSTVMETALIGRHPFLPAWRWESKLDQQIALDALAAVGMSEFESRIVSTLSGGERRRLSIATVLTQQPDLLLLDEPTNHLDVHYQIAILDTVTQYIIHGGKSLVMVLHDANLASRYCDHIVMLYGDGKYDIGSSAEILDANHLQRLYGHVVHCLPGPNGDFFIPA